MKPSRPKPAHPEHTLLHAELPGANGEPLLSLRVEMTSTPQGEGERVRLRAHLQARLANAAGSLPAPDVVALDAPRGGGARLPARRAAALIQRGLSHPLVQRLAAPLMKHDVQTWLEVQASTAALADGVRALLPSRETLARLGVQLPAEIDDAPMAQTWGGRMDGPREGVAQFSLLRLDKRHLPPAVASLLGRRPFQLVAALASVVERHEPGKR